MPNRMLRRIYDVVRDTSIEDFQKNYVTGRRGRVYLISSIMTKPNGKRFSPRGAAAGQWHRPVIHDRV